VELQIRRLEHEASVALRSARVKLLAFSDLHRDLGRARRLVEMAADADVVIAAGDFASIHSGLEETLAPLRQIDTPTVVVPGNNETESALREGCSGWDAATVLHGEGTVIDEMAFWGLGAGVPVTPWDWSFDLDEQQAAAKLAGCPMGAVLALHSPPKGHVDAGLGSQAILEAIEDKRPPLAVCGHIHQCWGQESRVGPSRIVNLGPDGTVLEV
jgi:Icc-related predicted phosphoesterase